MTDLPVFLINLDGSNDRLVAATTAMQAEGVSFVRHAAFDGRYLDLTQVPEYSASAARAYMGRDLTGGEVGCYISHVQVAVRFLETDSTYALVLEDDMRPLPGWMAITRALATNLQTSGCEWDVAHLAAQRLKIATPILDVTTQSQHATVHRAHYFPMRTTAMLWSRKGAERFVRTAYPITCPVDIHLRRLMQQNDGGVALEPPCFSTTDVESDIVAGQTAKRGTDSRGIFYPVKRAARVVSGNLRAAILRHRARRNV
ncbi:MAG: glycosyltransferase family 25 protein [Sulfitobacter sp.]